MSASEVIGRAEAAVNLRHGGDIRIFLSPGSVGATSGFLGTMDIAPGESVSGHYHPYSDEFVYVVRGTLTIDTGDRQIEVGADESIMIPKPTPHRYTNNSGDEPVFLVFQIAPLAPRPELGHVATEPVPRPGDPPPVVGGA
jgi:putative monooxygenase